MDGHQHDTQPWALREGRAPAHGLPSWPPQDHHAGGRTAHDRHGCAHGARWPDQRRLVRGLCHIRGLCHTGPRAGIAPGRRRHHGQLVEPQAASVRERIEEAGATLVFLPLYSPDFNPIEKAFARLKAMLRKIGERTVSGLWDLIGKLVDIFQPTECANYVRSCGYDPS